MREERKDAGPAVLGLSASWGHPGCTFTDMRNYMPWCCHAGPGGQERGTGVGGLVVPRGEGRPLQGTELEAGDLKVNGS